MSRYTYVLVALLTAFFLAPAQAQTLESSMLGKWRVDKPGKKPSGYVVHEVTPNKTMIYGEGITYKLEYIGADQVRMTCTQDGADSKEVFRGYARSKDELVMTLVSTNAPMFHEPGEILIWTRLKH